MLAIAGSAKSTDIIFILDNDAAFHQGHIAVLIGSENTGWRYVSINGTGSVPTPWGINTNPDTGTIITDESGQHIRNLRRAIRRACEINPKEHHQYRHFKRIHTTAEEDSAALSASTTSGNRYRRASPPTWGRIPQARPKMSQHSSARESSRSCVPRRNSPARSLPTTKPPRSSSPAKKKRLKIHTGCSWTSSSGCSPPPT